MINPPPRGLRARLADLAQDAGALVGFVCIIHGIDLISRPAAYIVGGVIVVTVAWISARRSAG